MTSPQPWQSAASTAPQAQQSAVFTTTAGASQPLGASLMGDDSWNFAVFAPDANKLLLCLYCADTEELLAELPFTGRTGEIWHLRVTGIVKGTLYV